MSDKVNQKVRTAVRKVPLSRFETPLNIERPSLQHGNVSSGDDDFVVVGQQDVEQTNVEKGKKRAGMKSKATRSPRRKHVNVEKGKKMNYLTTRWRKNRDKATPLVQGCIAFIMIYYLDNLECDDMIADFVSIPRARFFTSAIIEKIASADRESHDGYLSYGKLPLRERIGSCYANIGDHISDGQQKMEFLSALELHDKDVDDAIIKINEAHKDIEEAQQKFASEIKHMFGDLVGHSLNTESPRDIRRKRRAERPLGGSSLNVKRKSQIPRDVSPVHIDSGDDCPEIVVERSPQSSAGQSSFEQQEAAHAPSDTHVQHEVEQTVTVESVHEEVIHAELHTAVQHEGTELGVDARAQQEILTPATDTPVQHEPTQPEATTVEHVEVELPAADTTDEVIRESDTCVQRSGVFDGDFNYEDWNEVGNILRELNEDPTQVSLRKEYDIKEAAALTGEKEKAKKIISARKLKSNTKKATRANKRKITHARRMKEVKSVEKKLRNLFLYPKDLGVDATFVSSSLDVQMIIPSPFKPPYVPRQPPDTTLVVALKTLIFTNDSFEMRRCAGYRVILPTFISQIILFENYTSESQYDENTVPSLLDERLKAHDLLNASLLGSPYIDVPKQVLVNDCGFFVMLFLEHYDGERRKFDVPIIPEKGTQYRAELMYYLFFHKMNEARGPSLELFELLAPGKTEHNVIEGTQQINDSSDATKVGVASCDVEKDDVASRDE
ncbi:hypothetical protein GUJ93_ZPchr0004g40472 [Zizania palustris]|uniref:Ubiquitin-like protease family profile domain-containing protein n=1 Tax=Zizania palustris TaxID=103762 RepID=A0A8J5SJK9_ZIZPA|nr:hypothetical protein GUJ93_ZPchr0004g40472 [Zizania palustris]